MSHARIEEVSDSDPEIDDPTNFLPDSDKSIIAPAHIPLPQSSSETRQPQSPPFQDLPQALRPQASSAPKIDRTQFKTYQCLYPIYFDSTRSKAGGRRVSKALATPNPLARTLVDAVSSACGTHQLRIAFEPDKTHPKDWANPGRVRVQLYSADTHKTLHPVIRNKAHLYILVARYLQAHPTKATDPLALPIEGLPMPKHEHLVPPPKPRGWKMNDVLPVHSPAMTGGGVNDNFMGDMMKELQNAQQAGGGQGNPMASMLGALGGGGGGSSAPSADQSAKRKMDMEKPKAGQGQKDRSGGGLTFGHSK